MNAHRLLLAAAIIVGWCSLSRSLARGQTKAEERVTDLILAASNGDAEKVKQLLAAKVDVNAKGTNGVTALHAASFKGDIATVRLLLGSGASVYSKLTNGVTPLIAACQVGNIEVVKALLAAAADVNAKAAEGATPLIRACLNNDLAVARVLLAAKADVNQRSNDGATALILSAQKGYLEMVKLLLASGADASARTTDGKTALSIASAKGYNEIVAALQTGPAASGNDALRASLPSAQRSQTLAEKPVAESAESASVNEAFLSSDSDPAAATVRWNADVKLWQPLASLPESAPLRGLVSAAFKGAKAPPSVEDVRIAVARFINDSIGTGDRVVVRMVEAQPDPRIRGAVRVRCDVVTGDSAASYVVGDASGRASELHTGKYTKVSLAGAEARTDYLLTPPTAPKDRWRAKLTDPFYKGAPGSLTSLFQACVNADSLSVQRLVASGKDLEETMAGGATPLMLCSMHGVTKGVALLLAGGAKVNAATSNGATALYFAAQDGHTEIVRLLLNAGADVNAKGSDEWTALHTAVWDDYQDIVALLLKKGAARDAKNKDGDTPLKIAQDRGLTAMAQLLEAKAVPATPAAKRPPPQAPAKKAAPAPKK